LIWATISGEDRSSPVFIWAIISGKHFSLIEVWWERKAKRVLAAQCHATALLKGKVTVLCF
jgi:hypothetical protein